MSKKRDQLIQTGETLFVKHGLSRVTVEEICRQADVSKPTFYKYFKSKEALARCIDELWIEEALQRIDEIDNDDAPFTEKMKQILAVKKDLSARPGPEFMEDLIHLNIDLSHALRRVMQFLVKYQHRGDMRADIRPEFLMAAFDAINKLQVDNRIQQLYGDAETLAEDVFNLFYYGALSLNHRQASFSEPSTDPPAKDESS
jgi:AcrR family transcriptional regulator